MSRALAQTLVLAVGLSAVTTAACEAATFSTLFDFTVRANGVVPLGPLTITSAGKIYGVTEQGGYGPPNSLGEGVVFAFKPGAASKPVMDLYKFGKVSGDGAAPSAGVVSAPKGLLYGVTSEGGATGKGTIYSFDTKTHVETVVYSFGSKPNATDGASPNSQLVRADNGRLYGTTYSGGVPDCNCGTVFRFDPASKTLKTMYAFRRTNVYFPQGVTFNPAKTLLYGVTNLGGNFWHGAVFTIDPETGAETTVYSFTGGVDGESPMAPPIFDAQGNAYGTTSEGSGSQQPGTVYELTPGNAFTTLATLPQGYVDSGLVIDQAGVLYGTGANGGSGGFGYVYSVVPGSGTATLLHEFSGPDGKQPGQLVLTSQGILYGTTLIGGSPSASAYASSIGTLFEIVP